MKKFTFAVSILSSVLVAYALLLAIDSWIPIMITPASESEAFFEAFSGSLDAIRFWAPIVNATKGILMAFIPPLSGIMMIRCFEYLLFKKYSSFFPSYAVGILCILALVTQFGSEQLFVCGAVLLYGLHALIFHTQNKEDHSSTRATD